MARATTDRRSPWVIGIVIGFALMILANAVFVYVAVHGQDDIVSSYRTEAR